ncbi:MAG: TraM recognition domain-containing protein, partial [Trueperaceae bacterium]
IAAALVDRKLSTPLFAAGFDVCAFGVQLDQEGRLRVLASQVAAAYAAYGDPAGGGLVPGLAGRFNGSAPRLALHLNAAEAATLWHLPHAADAPVSIRRTTARTLAPAPGHAGRGARVGVAEAAGTTMPIAQHSRLLHRNQLIVAKTRRGKSTLLRHMAAGIMEGAASDADGTALVVVDPHQDLAEAVLDAVPSALAARTVYLDFANLERPVGLNLLDVHLFPDRDRTTEHVVTMLNRLWPANWGPRMEGALRASLASLLEANLQVPRDRQFTLLDVAPFLTDAKLRERVLTQVQDPALQAWWRDNYDRAGRVLQQQTANPVTSKIGRFTVTEASRLVLGQASSTFDPRALLRDGGVLVVNTAVGALGEGAASLVGATLLNLLGLIVEEQVMVPAAQRRRVVSLVDESSTLGAVDYPRMLSELGKYGASFVLVTQSLSKLDAIDRNLAPTIFANSDGLTVFQVSAEDARKLVPELGSEIEVEDLVSLDDFTCYARWWDG